ncbi:hypothetical protein [Leptospira gomenensis]|nr:hypothetical protein [Leptospira gomenensis]
MAVAEQTGRSENSSLHGFRKRFDKVRACSNGIEIATCKTVFGPMYSKAD